MKKKIVEVIQTKTFSIRLLIDNFLHELFQLFNEFYRFLLIINRQFTIPK